MSKDYSKHTTRKKTVCEMARQINDLHQSSSEHDIQVRDICASLLHYQKKMDAKLKEYKGLYGNGETNWEWERAGNYEEKTELRNSPNYKVGSLTPSGKVSLIIAARCEKYLQPTIDTAIENASGEIEVIPVIDGRYEKNSKYDPAEYLPLKEHPLVHPIYLDKSIGQRAAYNLGVKESKGEYIIKLDGHAILSPIWDVLLKEAMRECGNRTVILPIMKRLNAEEWVPKRRSGTSFMYFGTDLMCGYWNSYGRRPAAKEKYPEVMTGQGSCWFIHREWNDYIGLLDEKATSWGKVGLEVSIKTWCQGGSQRLCRDVWQAHHFRWTEGGFPYAWNGRTVSKSHDYAKKNWYFNDKFFGEKQVRPFRWIIEKFAPVPGWEIYMKQTNLKRGIIFYSDHKIEESLFRAVRGNIAIQVGDLIDVVDVDIDITRDKEQQIIQAVKKIDADIIYLCNDKTIYHASYFAYIPENKKKVYFNQNCYNWRVKDTDFVKATIQQVPWQMVGYKKAMIKNIDRELYDNDFENFESEKPNVEIVNHIDREAMVSQSVDNIPFWGGPRHMMKKIKYKGTLRTDVINYLIEQNNYKSYLEIGYKKGDNFNSVHCDNKDSIDPNGKAKYNMTSDEFFQNHCNGNRYDIVFIDGLHEANQVLRDIDNGLKVLNDGGVIVMHDCLPEKEEQQVYPAPEDNKIRIWNGTVWKAFARKRSQPDLLMYTIDTNNGIGIVRPGSQIPYALSDNLDWNYFKQYRNKLMNVVSVEEFKRKERRL